MKILAGLEVGKPVGVVRYTLAGGIGSGNESVNEQTANSYTTILGVMMLYG